MEGPWVGEHHGYRPRPWMLPSESDPRSMFTPNAGPGPSARPPRGGLGHRVGFPDHGRCSDGGGRDDGRRRPAARAHGPGGRGAAGLLPGQLRGAPRLAPARLPPVRVGPPRLRGARPAGAPPRVRVARPVAGRGDAAALLGAPRRRGRLRRNPRVAPSERSRPASPPYAATRTPARASRPRTETKRWEGPTSVPSEAVPRSTKASTPVSLDATRIAASRAVAR